MGTVSPRAEGDLIPEVSGRVVWVSDILVSGGFFEKGEALIRIDRADYEASLVRARASLARAKSDSRRAVKELGRLRKLSNRGVSSESQLDDAAREERVTKAMLAEAEANLGQAQRDLSRCEIPAPYKGRVRKKNVDVGQFVTRGTSMARLYAIDFAEIRLPIPDDELAFLSSASGGVTAFGIGSPVILTTSFAGAEHRWMAEVVRSEGEIDASSRMVHLVARIDDPYAAGEDGAKPPLVVGQFVQAEILGRRIDGAVELPRSVLRDGTRVLVVDSEDRLRSRRVDVIRRDYDRVVISAETLEPSDRVVDSFMESVVDGMKVRPVVSGRRDSTTEQKDIL